MSTLTSAFDKSRGKDDENAAMIFDDRSLVLDGVIVYGSHKIRVSDLTTILDTCRTCIKDLVSAG